MKHPTIRYEGNVIRIPDGNGGDDWVFTLPAGMDAKKELRRYWRKLKRESDFRFR